ncbi:lysylphosphatidylglycerol synthase transmembrane domain-containing protein [Maribacter polysaccharolyticus]|uniref:lysylphosphatidylglycerol synthase transmembrane domain-containing protein n=1 Tax=Maribacter polysaccharolyticus TaxID=3020831 RepID=UPI00237F6B61|nr:lysylphosphatidylglycerol synthase transmembrane domain-containing protein [Maribacter polysaccharolyticus]MDE3741911.1 lysylphosphatidylglycerol synthase transmembrane domain-containing protein [Maribacter polysaccharolyticus]
MDKRLRKKLVTIAKIAISAILIYFIFTKVDFKEVVQTVRKSNPFYLMAAILFFIGSKVLASVRLNLYFHGLQVKLTQKSNLQLYLLGMFYNLFLPGGIGGDAYKGYLIKKEFEVSTKKVVSVLVLDRLSGLLLLFIYACILGILLDTPWLNPYDTPIGILALLAVIVFWFLNKRFFHFVLPIFWRSFGFSALVQLCQLICVVFILFALKIDTNNISYLFIFLISSIVSVLPLTIGGIGSREVTFFYGATLLALDENTSIGISMVFFLITALVSLLGVIYHFKKIKLKTAL